MPHKNYTVQQNGKLLYANSVESFLVLLKQPLGSIASDFSRGQYFFAAYGVLTINQ